MSRNFRELLEDQWAAGKSLCVGLDTDLERLPEHLRENGIHDALLGFNRGIVDATKDIVGSYKLNTAFYEAHGDEGFAALRASISYINEVAPALPVILDAKRADIGNTNYGYVASAFEHLRADAITVQPYAGGAALAPFLEQKERGIIVWCRSSNEGAGEFQDLLIDGEPLYIHVARHVAKGWNGGGNCALVVGATYPDELARVRREVGDMPILIPGVGAQGGDLEKTIAAGKDSRGRGMMIAVSRTIIFASRGMDYAEAAAAQAKNLHEAIQRAL